MKKLLAAIAVMNVATLGTSFATESAETINHSRSEKICAVGSARLQNVKGTVLLSRSTAFSQAREGLRLAAGDRVYARKGSADIFVGRNIVTRVSNGVMLTINEKDGSTCVARVSASPSAVGRADGSSEDGLPLTQEELLALGAVVGVTAAGLGVGLSNVDSGDSNNGLPPLLVTAPISNTPPSPLSP
ncbi:MULTISPECIES: hypothetical protein [Methylosinus]|uniref:FecR protein domain-containing protein n=1 Tax=Methylosinus trichosporium (strain ATCC 35070 / NCIMB 11131 / UNIQEM 75 / OB3b) TaxID=595536 RepID=A0A2D2D3I5_METT3|nr:MULTISPECIES: hypothetical protein [Methylosinus]ATQ69558.1 hypothetical protein CQW49_17990 [Methylosinus trichosporium OB3b]OBS50479.1 hypothetical protein A8B73_21200 [Methylosinus sp. 3S-1]